MCSRDAWDFLESRLNKRIAMRKRESNGIPENYRVFSVLDMLSCRIDGIVPAKPGGKHSPLRLPQPLWETRSTCTSLVAHKINPLKPLLRLALLLLCHKMA